MMCSFYIIFTKCVRTFLIPRVQSACWHAFMVSVGVCFIFSPLPPSSCLIVGEKEGEGEKVERKRGGEEEGEGGGR
jgi:hypothetical protein